MTSLSRAATAAADGLRGKVPHLQANRQVREILQFQALAIQLWLPSAGGEPAADAPSSEGGRDQEMSAMEPTAADAGWKGRALAGSPDFLKDVKDGTVTWSQLWSFYRQTPADSGAVLALTGFFHLVQFRRFEREGSVLDRDGRVYADLQEWACFAVAGGELVPEARLRDSLAGLLGLSLISPLYYELVFGCYLEASLERQEMVTAGEGPLLDAADAAGISPPGRLPVRLREGSRPLGGQRDAATAGRMSALLARHYPGWNEAYTLALGDRVGEQFDEGGEA
jgi:hypothetical protein